MGSRNEFRPFLACAALSILLIGAGPRRGLADPPVGVGIVPRFEIATAGEIPSDTEVLLAADADTATAPTAEPAEPAPPPRPSRNILRDGGNAFKVLASDAWSIVSSPTRMNRRDFLIVGATLATTAVLYNNDDAIYRASHRNHDDPVYHAFFRLGKTVEPLGFMGRTNKYYLGAMVLGYALEIEPLRVIPAQFLESHLIAGGLRNILKPLVGRRHPYEDEGSRAFSFGNGTSFPSGHTSVAYELATILSHHAHRWPVTVATYGAATAMAVQRIDSGNHWASDVFFPAVTGTFIARAIVRRRDERVAVLPTVGPDGLLGVRVSCGF